MLFSSSNLLEGFVCSRMWVSLCLKDPFAFQLTKSPPLKKHLFNQISFLFKSTFTTDMLHQIRFKYTHANCELSDPCIPVFCLKTWLNYAAEAARPDSKCAHHEEKHRKKLVFTQLLYFPSVFSAKFLKGQTFQRITL